MRVVRVDRNRLVEILKENREKHRKVFDEALKGFKERLEEELERKLEDLRQGRRVDSAIRLTAPEDHTRDYDRVIRQLELTVDPQVELTDQEFGQYVMDQWGWFESFVASNAVYAASAVTDAYGMGVFNGDG